MLSIQHMHIKRIAAMVAVVLVLIILLLYMQGTFVSKVSPGLTPQAGQPSSATADTAIVMRKRVDNKMAGLER